VTTPLDANSVVHTPVNFGTSTRGGLELIASRRLTPSIDFTFNLNGFYSELDARALGLAQSESVVSFEAKAALNLRPTAKSRAQLNLNSMGKQLTPQGYRQGSTALDAGYRYQIRPNVALVSTVSDVFASRRNRVVLSSLRVDSSNEVEQPGRIIYLGVSWTLAGKGEKAEKFEYDR
jgi:outer membrane receptor for ferrienterochelin and colicin